MKKAVLFFILGMFAFGCSSSDDDATVDVKADMKLKIDGVAINFPNNSAAGSSYAAYKKGDNYTIVAGYGQFGNADSTFLLTMTFSSEGKFVLGSLDFNSVNFGQPHYKNFIHFPSNYIQVTEFSVDEATKRIKVKFNGKLYIDEQSIASESRTVEAEVDMAYTDQGDDPFPIVVRNIEQYCRANINGAPWAARFERNLSSFTNEDPYKVEINFANSPTPGSFNFTSASTSNYVKFSKFNTTTLVYDYYNVTGQVAYSYREYHGYTDYSFIGTYSFTAVNPNNPADVIQVTDGVFRSYQSF